MLGSKPKPITYIVDNNGCYICTSHYKNADGYYPIKRGTKHTRLHRMILEDKLGRPIKDKYEATHLCNNTNCINPEHLKEDTHANNMLYMKETNRASKVSRKSFLATRIEDSIELVSDNQTSFAKAYNLQQSHINNCLRGINKSHKGWKFKYL